MLRLHGDKVLYAAGHYFNTCFLLLEFPISPAPNASVINNDGAGCFVRRYTETMESRKGHNSVLLFYL